MGSLSRKLLTVDGCASPLDAILEITQLMAYLEEVGGDGEVGVDP